MKIGALAVRIASAALCIFAAAPLHAQSAAEAAGWITHAEATPDARPIVLQFRRELTLPGRPATFPVKVSADNRFILFVNGQRVAAGPSIGDIAHWRYSRLDLAPFLRRGTNVVAAVVWNGVKPTPPPLPPSTSAAERQTAQGTELTGQTAPLFQQSVATGFRLEGAGAVAFISTSNPGWQVKVDPSRTFDDGSRQIMAEFGVPEYYVAGAPEIIDAAKADADLPLGVSKDDGWTDAVPGLLAAERTMVPDRLPQQKYSAVDPGEVVRTDLIGGQMFPAKPVTVPAHSTAKLLLRRDAMVSAYPALTTVGGAGATIKVTYAEALYDANGKKGDRDEIEGREPKGITDTFLADGRQTTFWPLWWRTWRFLELDVTTAAEPLTLEDLAVYETGYPFDQIGEFRSSDPALDRIWQIGWRTALVDAHETYMDSSFWEQLQYVGDTRIQMLISYAVSGDPRLAEQAIDAFAHSSGAGGLTEGAYPSRGSNVIPPFSLLWIGMLDDWRMQQSDRSVLVRHLPRMREALAWFEPWLSSNDLLTKNPGWNFIDWAGQSWDDRTVFPSYSKEGETCLVSAVYLGALQQAAELENYVGDAARGRENADLAERMTRAIRKRCWAADRQMFADNPDKQLFSQHTNALAVLYGVVSKEEGQALLQRIVAPGQGIDAPEGMRESSYYFAWYLVRAFEKAGLGEQYHALLRTWRDLLKLNYTTWPEARGDTRSDTHAWSAHPTADLLSIVAGIQPAAAGYTKVRVRPALGHLTSLDAIAVTPKGPVRISYRVSGSKLTANIVLPPTLAGTFEWRGMSHALKPGGNEIEVAAQ